LGKCRELKWEVVDNGCWNITSHAKNKKGYHVFKRDGKNYRIHRWMYMHHTGDKDIETYVILHTCDNPSCCNPEHLRKGTQQENINDRVEKNRSAKGENHGLSKLSDEQASFILNDPHYKITDLAKLFDVYPNVIKQIKQRKTWKHIS
jgi:hypothetical protein